MASVEIIGRSLAGTTHYQATGGSHSPVQLSKTELAGLLSGLNQAQMHFAYAKYGEDPDSERKLIGDIQTWVQGYAVNHHWQADQSGPFIDKMCYLASIEVVRPNRCGHCRGTAMAKHKICTVCSGSGYKRLSGRRIAEIVGMDECKFRRTWRGRYEAIIAYVQQLDSEVRFALWTADLMPIF
jgi:hypothetical protein